MSDNKLTKQPYGFQEIISAKKNKDYKLMNEASLSRVYSHYLDMKEGRPESSFAMISPFRKTFSAKQNQERWENMIKIIKSMGLTFIKLEGYWQECQDEDVPYDQCPPDKLIMSKEKTMFLMNPTMEQTKKLMNIFSQDAVVYAGPETKDKVALIFRTSGDIVELGDFNVGTLNQGYSKIKGQAFFFEYKASTNIEKLIESLFS